MCISPMSIMFKSALIRLYMDNTEENIWQNCNGNNISIPPNAQHIQVKVINSFAHESAPEYNPSITAYSRIFANLLKGGTLGRIYPIYLDDGVDCKILGILTYNPHGGHSLFLEFPGDIGFDHITLSNTVNGNHHATGYISNKKVKIHPITAISLTTGIYDLLSIGTNNLSPFKLAPKYINYPTVPVKYLARLNDCFSYRNGTHDSILIKISKHNRPVCIQFHLIPNNIDHTLLDHNADFLKVLNLESYLNGVSGNTACTILESNTNCDYRIGIISTCFEKAIDKSVFSFGIRCNANGFYTKWNININ